MRIRAFHRLPVVLLTAHADSDTLSRAKEVEPFGYLAMIHETLYGSGSLRDIDFQEYVEQLLRELLTSYGLSSSRVRPVVRVIPMRLDMDRATLAD